MAKKFDITLLYIVILVLGFLSISFNERVGLVYAVIILGVLTFTRKKLFVNAVSGNTPKAIFHAFIAYGILFFIHYFSSFILQGFTSITAEQSISQSFYQMVSLMKTQAVLPLAQSKLLSFVTEGFLIPIIELFFIGTMLEFFAEKSKTPLVLSKRLVVVFLVVSGIFTWFHVNVRGVSNVGWFITFVFGIITCYMIVRSQEMESAGHLHIINNVIAKLVGG